MKFGEYLIAQNTIDAQQLKEALLMQEDNPQLKLGEILVAEGFLKNQELIDLIESFVKETGEVVAEVTEWLSQDEADALIAKLKSGNGS